MLTLTHRLVTPNQRPLSTHRASFVAYKRVVCKAAEEQQPNDPSQDVAKLSGGPLADEDGSVGAALHRGLTEISKTQNRTAAGSNLLLVGDTEDKWRALDKKVNKYPIQRSFTAIGTGGEEFRKAMVACVSAVVGSVHDECVSERTSSGGRYLSVTIDTFLHEPNQIIQIYANMKADQRVKWIL